MIVIVRVGACLLLRLNQVVGNGSIFSCALTKCCMYSLIEKLHIYGSSMSGRWRQRFLRGLGLSQACRVVLGLRESYGVL